MPGMKTLADDAKLSCSWPDLKAGEALYANALAAPTDLADWKTEGSPRLTFAGGAMRLANGLDPALGQAANFVLWCPQPLPADFLAIWTFRPLV